MLLTKSSINQNYVEARMYVPLTEIFFQPLFYVPILGSTYFIKKTLYIRMDIINVLTSTSRADEVNFFFYVNQNIFVSKEYLRDFNIEIFHYSIIT